MHDALVSPFPNSLPRILGDSPQGCEAVGCPVICQGIKGIVSYTDTTTFTREKAGQNGKGYTSLKSWMLNLDCANLPDSYLLILGKERLC